jgi:DDE superfamily endonuclease
MMLKGVKNIWRPSTLAKGGRMTYLLLDECQSHMTSAVGRAFAECNTEIDIIPGGYTSKLQAKDVGINKPFKPQCRYNFDLWIKVL